jgi:hypothetical protein
VFTLGGSSGDDDESSFEERMVPQTAQENLIRSTDDPRVRDDVGRDLIAEGSCLFRRVRVVVFRFQPSTGFPFYYATEAIAIEEEGRRVYIGRVLWG